MLYVVKFNNGADYAILSADTRVSSVIGITGTGIAEEFTSAQPYTYRPAPPQFNMPVDYWQTINDGDYEDYDEADDEIIDDGWDLDDNFVETDEELFALITDFAVSYAIEEIIKYYEAPETRAIFPDWNWNGKTWVTTDRVNVLCRTVWHQNDPYNDAISKHLLRFWWYDMGSRYKAGCVAIALSQILTAHECPAKIHNVTLPWHAIRNVGTYRNGSYNDGTAWEKSWASWLVGQVGLDAKTSYGYNASSSTYNKAIKALKGYGYRNVKKYESNNNVYTLTKTMLKSGKPVFYRGQTHTVGGKGHAWLIDGLWHVCNKAKPSDKMELRHVNFGWGGSHNGWYKDGVFNPSRDMVSYNSGYGDYYDPKGGSHYKRKVKIIYYDLP